MRNLIYLYIITLFFSACSGNKDIDAPATPKNITRVFIAPELPVQQKTSTFYVGVRYSKDYSSDDQITLSFNGQNGVVQNTSKSELEGTNVLFLFQPTGQAMSGKLKLMIKNDQKTFEKEQDFRIVEDLDLKTVWNALDKSYFSSFDRQIDRFKTGSFGIITSAPSVLGVYLDDTAVLPDRYGKTLVPGLQGKYELTYAGDVLTEMKVTHGEPQVNATFSSQNIYTNLAIIYGNHTSRVQQDGFEVTTYQTSEFSLTTYLNQVVMYTLIRKK